MDIEQKASTSTTDEAAGNSADGKGISRRTLVIGAGSTAVMFGLGATRFLASTPAVRPPGGQDENRLVSACIRCNRCVEACPHGIIVPSHIEYGLLGVRTPRMSFSENTPGAMDVLAYCDFCAEANGGVPLCVKVCPTEALSPEVIGDTSSVVMGVAEIDTNLCMAYRSGFCAFCHDACVQVRGEDAAAIYYTGSEPNLLPEVDAAKCNGCGACESVCVSVQAGSLMSATDRAIVVKSVQA